MPYKVTAPEVSLLRDLGVYKDNEGKVIGYDRDSVIRLQDEIVADEDVAQIVKDAYEAGDPHTRGILEYVDEDPEPQPEKEHDVNQDLNISDPEDPVKDKEFETVQHPEDGPQQHQPAEKADAVDKEESSDDGDPDDLSKLSREELNAKAAELGIDNPEKIKGGKLKVIEAIEAAQADQGNSEGTEPEGDKDDK